MQIILITESTKSCNSDYKYIKSCLDYFYCSRENAIKNISAKCKSELIKQDVKIENLRKRFHGHSEVIICADFDDKEDPDNGRIIKYARKNGYNIAWMNIDVEEVFLGKRIKKKDKSKEALNFLKKKDILLCKNDCLAECEPFKKHPCSNLLVVLDKYLKRKSNIN